MDQNNTSPILWRITLFGSLHADGPGRTLARFPTQRAGMLLAFLAFYRHRRHFREQVTDLLWPEAELAAARDRLSQLLVWLRPRLEPDGVARKSVLLTDRLSIGLNPLFVSTDVAEFETALAVAKEATASALQREALCHAVALYQGDLLPGYYHEWILTERQRLQTLYLLALRHLTDLFEQVGDYERALDYARLAVASDRLQEEVHADLIRLFAATGQTAAALRQFQQLTALLDSELSLSPSAETQELIDQIRRKEAIPQAKEERIKEDRLRLPVLRTPLTRFFGREAEIARISRMLLSEGARLVTLTGIGGAGKTRLSLAASARLVDAYHGAVVFVPLADLADVQMIPAALASALRLPDAALGSAWEQVVEALSVQPFLLILDNVEHLLGEAASLVRELLERVPALTVLATSRQRLGLEGEREVSVPPLPLPGPEATLEQILASSSAQLFMDRAQSVRPDFTVTRTNGKAVAAVCTRLEGIPLAIELCAAWAQTLSPAQMLEMLERRFDLLVSRRSDSTPRHRTLRAALEYSYLQLPDDLQRLFAHLSVFRDGWSLEAAEAVCLDSPNLTTTSMATTSVSGSPTSEQSPFPLLTALTELRERSLILAEEVATGESGVEMRYRMLETLREFAGEQANASDLAMRRQAHASYFLRLAEQADAAMNGPDQERWLTRLAREQENLRVALAWSLEVGAKEFGLRLGVALGLYWSMCGPLREGYTWLRQLLDSGKTIPGETLSMEVSARAWQTLGYLAWLQGDYAAARTAHEQALTLRQGAADAVGITESLYHLGITTYRQDNYRIAQEYFEASLALAQARGDRASIARVFLNLGNIAYEQKREADAHAYFQQSLTLEQELGNRQRVANALNNLGLVAIANRDYSAATELFQQSLAIRRDLTDHYGTAVVLANLGTTARLCDQKERSRALLREGLQIAYDFGNKHIMVHHLLQLGMLESSEANFTRCILLISGAQRLVTVTGSARGISAEEGHEQALSTARAALGETAFAALWSRGQKETLGQIVTLALSSPHEADDGNSPAS